MIWDKTRCIILCGGQGTRVKTVLGDSPKALARIHGTPFIEILFQQLLAFGCREVLLCTGYQAEQLHRLVGEKYRGMAIQYSHEDRPLGTGGAVVHALDKIPTEKILVLNGDSFAEYNLSDLVVSHLERDPAVTILAKEMPNSSRYGKLEINQKGWVTRFQEKSATDNENAIVNLGVYIFSKKFLLSYSRSRFQSLETELLPNLIPKKIGAHITHGQFIDIGTPESLEFANQEHCWLRTYIDD
jgi:D-glycero-alpha-D-manno-heptose 1-phosphate guanylyltransferase